MGYNKAYYMDINNLCFRIKDERLKKKMNAGLFFGQKLLENIASRIQKIFSNGKNDNFSELDNNSFNTKKVKCSEVPEFRDSKDKDSTYNDNGDDYSEDEHSETARCSRFIQNSNCDCECMPKEELYFQGMNFFNCISLKDENKCYEQHCDIEMKNETPVEEHSESVSDANHSERRHSFSDYQPESCLNEKKLSFSNIDNEALLNFDKMLLNFPSVNNSILPKNDNVLLLEDQPEMSKIFRDSKLLGEEIISNMFSGNKGEKEYNLHMFDEFDFLIESLKDIVFLKKIEMNADKEGKQIMDSYIQNTGDEEIEYCLANNFNSEKQNQDSSTNDSIFSSSSCTNSNICHKSDMSLSQSSLSPNAYDFIKNLSENYLKFSQLPFLKSSILMQKSHVNTNVHQCINDITDEPVLETSVQRDSFKNEQSNVQMNETDSVSNSDILENNEKKNIFQEKYFDSEISPFMLNTRNELLTVDDSNKISYNENISTAEFSYFDQDAQEIYPEDSLQVLNLSLITENTSNVNGKIERFDNSYENNDQRINKAAYIKKYVSKANNMNKSIGMKGSLLESHKYPLSEYDSNLNLGNSQKRSIASIYDPSENEKDQVTSKSNENFALKNIFNGDHKSKTQISEPFTFDSKNLPTEKLKKSEKIGCKLLDHRDVPSCYKFKKVMSESYLRINIQRNSPRNIQNKFTGKEINPVSNIGLASNCCDKFQFMETTFCSDRLTFLTNSRNVSLEVELSSEASTPGKSILSEKSTCYKEVTQNLHARNNLKVINPLSINKICNDSESTECIENSNENYGFDVNSTANNRNYFEKTNNNHDSDIDDSEKNVYSNLLDFLKPSSTNEHDANAPDDFDSGSNRNQIRSNYALSASIKDKTISKPNHILSPLNSDNNPKRKINEHISFHRRKMNTENFKIVEEIGSVNDAIHKKPPEYCEFFDFLQNKRKKIRRSNSPKEMKRSIIKCSKDFMNIKTVTEAFFLSGNSRLYANRPANIRNYFEKMNKNCDSDVNDSEENGDPILSDFLKNSPNEQDANAPDDPDPGNSCEQIRSNYTLSANRKGQTISKSNQMIYSVNNFNLHGNNLKREINELAFCQRKKMCAEDFRNTEELGNDIANDAAHEKPGEYGESFDFLQNKRNKCRKSNSPQEMKGTVNKCSEDFMNIKKVEETFFHIGKTNSMSVQSSKFRGYSKDKGKNSKSPRKTNCKKSSERSDIKSMPLKCKSKLRVEEKDKLKNKNSNNITKAPNKCIHQKQRKRTKLCNKAKKNITKISNSYFSSKSNVSFSCNGKSYIQQEQTIKIGYETQILESMECNCCQEERNFNSRKRRNSKSFNKISEKKLLNTSNILNDMEFCNSANYNTYFSSRTNKCYAKEMKFESTRQVQRNKYALKLYSSVPCSKTFNWHTTKVNPLQFSPSSQGATLDDLLPKSKYRKYEKLLLSIEYPEKLSCCNKENKRSKECSIVVNKKRKS